MLAKKSKEKLSAKLNKCSHLSNLISSLGINGTLSYRRKVFFGIMSLTVKFLLPFLGGCSVLG